MVRDGDGMGIAEAAAALGITANAVRKRVKRGSLVSYKAVSGEWRVVLPDNDVSRYDPVAYPRPSPNDVPRPGSATHVTGESWDTQPTPPVSVTVQQQAAALVIREALAPFIAELGEVRETLGRERTYRQVAERERDRALERVGALEARLAVPDVPDGDPAPIVPETLHAGRTGAEMESSVPPRNAAYGGVQSSPRRSWWRVLLGLDGGGIV